MASIRVLVAEDNPLHAARMEMLLDEMGYELVGIYDTTADLLRLFKATSPDLVILDIELKQGGDGVELAASINEIRPTPIIFATSFGDKKTISRALQSDPYAYLVKPIEKPSLQAAIELALFKFANHPAETAPVRYSGWSEDMVLNDSFYLKAGDRLVKVLISDILWIEMGEHRYCDLVTEDRKFHLRTTLKELLEKLDPRWFVQIHRSTVVNISKVTSIREVDLMLSISDRDLPIGKVYKDALLKRLRML